MTTTDKALSLHERAAHIERAFWDAYGRFDQGWLRDVYDTYVIVEAGDQCYRAEYAMAEDYTVTFAPRDSWVAVEKEWVAMKALTAVTGGLKALGEGKIGGYLVVFTDADHLDLHGDYFDKSTDFDLRDGERVTFYFNHGLDPVLKSRALGEGAAKLDDYGVWVEGILNLRDQWEQFIYERIEAGKMGLSSGTLPNLVERQRAGKGFHITKWPLGKDASITPTPAEPKTSVFPLKTFLSRASATAARPEAAPEGAAAPATQDATTKTQDATTKTQDATGIIVSDKHQEDSTMGEQDSALTLDALKTQLDAVGGKIEDVLKFMQAQPGVKDSGYFSSDGGKDPAAQKSFGDFLLAVARNDGARLKSVYGSLKDVDGSTGASGGWLLPTEFRQPIHDITFGTSAILSRVTRIPVSARAGEMPSLDVFAAPTAGVGNTADAGRVTAAARAEGGAYTETQPQFESISWKVTDAASGYVEVSKEMIADSPVSIEALLRRLFAIAIQNKLEYYILRGSGAGEPLGILNAPCAVGVDADSDNAFVFADAAEIYSRFLSVTGQGVWLYHPGALVDFAAMQVTANNAVTWITNLQGRPEAMLLGYPMEKSQHLPQPDTAGNVILADLAMYYLFERGGEYVDYSEHAAFTSGKGTWRFGTRVDGQPALKSAITLGDPQGSFTMSPFVYNND